MSFEAESAPQEWLYNEQIGTPLSSPEPKKARIPQVYTPAGNSQGHNTDL
jgi:hypothetical protein